jgi:hypothetical protein
MECKICRTLDLAYLPMLGSAAWQPSKVVILPLRGWSRAMSHKKNVPAYRLHKPSGLARVIIDHKQIYLGKYDSPESRKRYAELITEHLNNAIPGEPVPNKQGVVPNLSINELLVRYLQFANGYYSRDGVATGEVRNLKDAMVPLRELYGFTSVYDFGPRSLKAVRQYMITNCDLCRGVINARIDRIKRIFRWGVSEELVSSSICEGLRAVAGLRRGRSDARETEPVTPVDDRWVEATLPFLPPQVQDMIRLQRITGMRSGNLVTMKPCEIDRSTDIWIYGPAHHKTEHHGKCLQIPIGPLGQKILRPYVDSRPPNDYIFSHQEVQQWRMAHRERNRSTRSTPIYPSELRRLEKERLRRQRKPRKRTPRERYDSRSYRRAIEYALLKASKKGITIPCWYPLQIRHLRATEVRRRYGIEGAQLALGHTKANITEVYAERDMEFGKRIARKTG